MTPSNMKHQWLNPCQKTLELWWRERRHTSCK